MKSLKIKLFTGISMFVVALALLIVGVWAVGETQHINLSGSVNFTISDDTLYIKDIRIRESNDLTGQGTTIDNFLPGFVNGDIDIDLGTLSADTSFSLLFDVINTSAIPYQASTTSTISNAVLSVSATVVGDGIEPSTITSDTQSSGTIILTVTASSAGLVNLDGIVITLEQLVYENFVFDGNGALLGYSGSDAVVEIPASYSIIGEPEDKSVYIESRDFLYENILNDNYDFYKLTNYKIINDGSEYNFSDIEELLFHENSEDYFPCTIEYKDFSNVTFVYGDNYIVDKVIGAFNYNQNIQGVILPANIKSIGAFSFSYCANLKNIDIPEGVEYIGMEAFGGSGLTYVSLPNNLIEIGETAFVNCVDLINIDFSKCNGLEKIGYGAFSADYSLTSIDLSQCTLINFIDTFAFYDCSNLTSFKIGSSTPPSLEVDAFLMVNSDFQIQVPSASVNAYKSASGWSSYASQIVGY